MKTAAQILSYLESSLEESNRQYEYWKHRNPSESMKYRVQINKLEQILEEIDPTGEGVKAPEEEVNILVSLPEEPKPKKSFLDIYLNCFFFVVILVSCVAISSFLSDLLEWLAVDSFVSSLCTYGYAILHLASSVLVLSNSHKLLTVHKE